MGVRSSKFRTYQFRADKTELMGVCHTKKKCIPTAASLTEYIQIIKVLILENSPDDLFTSILFAIAFTST